MGIENSIDLSMHRWTIDTKKDFIFIKSIYEFINDNCLPYNFKDILKIITKNNYLNSFINENFRNEGYLKSLKTDKNIF